MYARCLWLTGRTVYRVPGGPGTAPAGAGSDTGRAGTRREDRARKIETIVRAATCFTADGADTRTTEHRSSGRTIRGSRRTARRRVCRAARRHQRAWPQVSKGYLQEADDDHRRLSKREIAVLTAMTDGLSNKEIARRLGISFHTVKFHVASILEKLEAESRTEAVFKAAQLGIVML